MDSFRNRARVAGLTCCAAIWLAACGGSEDTPPATEVEVEIEAPATPTVEETAAERLNRLREEALAKLGPEHRMNFEETENGEIRYSGKTEDGSPFTAQLGGDVDVPEGFFDEIPLYPDSVPFSAMEAGEGMVMVTVDSEADVSDIYEYYKTSLQDSGWALESDMNVSGGRLIRALKDGRRAVLHIQGTDAGARIGFMLSDEES